MHFERFTASPLRWGKTFAIPYGAVSDGCFATIQPLLLRGRDFTTQDRIGTPRVAIVDAGWAYGIAVLSRTRFDRAETHPLPTSPPQPRAGGAVEPRAALGASTVTPFGDLHVLNTHLDPSRGDDYRLQEVRTS